MEPERLKYRLYVFFLLVFTVYKTNGQGLNPNYIGEPWKFSVGTGVSVYQGDLRHIWHDDILPAIGQSFGIGIRKRLKSQLSFRLDLNYYHISAADSNTWGAKLKNRTKDKPFGEGGSRRDTRWVRNLSFSAHNLELSALMVFDWIDAYTIKSEKLFYSPYLFIGLGVTTNNPNAEIDGTKVNLRKLNTEALSKRYPGLLITLPVGAGVRFNPNGDLRLVIEGGVRFLGSDYLDDVSTDYASLEEFEATQGQRSGGDVARAMLFADRSPEIGWPLRPPNEMRGDEDDKDSFFIVQVRVEWDLNQLTGHQQRGRRNQRKVKTRSF